MIRVTITIEANGPPSHFGAVPVGYGFRIHVCDGKVGSDICVRGNDIDALVARMLRAAEGGS